VGRIGPLRFAVLSSGGSTEGIRVLADRLVQALSGIGNGRGAPEVSATIQEISPDQLAQLEARTLIGELVPIL
jgi:GGDEF domain-containing protein